MPGRGRYIRQVPPQLPIPDRGPRHDLLAHAEAGTFGIPVDGCPACRLQARTITMSQVARCPRLELAPGHYRDDGTCRCYAPALREATCAYCGQVKPKSEWVGKPWVWGFKGWVVCCRDCGGEGDDVEPP